MFAQDYTTRKTATGKAKKFYEKGMEYVFQNNDEKAIIEFEKVLKIDPTFIDAQIQWAAINYEQKRFKNAEIGFQKVLDIDPEHRLARRRLQESSDRQKTIKVRVPPKD